MIEILQALSHIMDMCAFELQETVEELMTWGEASFDDRVATFGDTHILFDQNAVPYFTWTDQGAIEWQQFYGEIA